MGILSDRNIALGTSAVVNCQMLPMVHLRDLPCLFILFWKLCQCGAVSLAPPTIAVCLAISVAFEIGLL